MKKILKLLLPVVVPVIVFAVAYEYIWEPSGHKKTSDYNNNVYKSCEVYMETGTYPNLAGYNQEFLDRFEPWKECEKITTTVKHMSSSAFAVFNTVMFSVETVILLLLIGGATIPFLLKYCKTFKSKQVKSILMRKDYKKFVRSLFADAYSNVWIVPVVLILIFLFCFAVTGHMDATYEALQDNAIDIKLLNSWSFYIKYLIVNILYSLVFINVGLIVLSKNKEFIISVIETFVGVIVVFYAIEYLGVLLTSVGVVGHEEYFWGLNVLRFNFFYNLNVNIFILVPLIAFILTSIIAIICYRDKEKLIRMCER